MSIANAKLWCASPDLPPGTIKVEWRGKHGSDFLLIEGNDADAVMEQWRAAPSDKERQQLLTGIIEHSRGVAA